MAALSDAQKEILENIKALTGCNDEIGERALRATNFNPDVTYALITEAPHQIPTMDQLRAAPAQAQEGGADDVMDDGAYGDEDMGGDGGAGAGLDLSSIPEEIANGI